ncbi:hypothetical protein [Caballeronia sp. Sq4a]|uniref:nSTAND1 domain-containing NTPase n=1 Tax=Caballeronia sp. Sq4a TaxID=2878152 RepID=UPI0020C039B8|nr:hypothetical protein [Caballeronia sp. Sq4a]
MDTLTTVQHWPVRPFMGLDYYRASDAALFRERDEDVRRCVRAFLSFEVKILVLQGSSGAGKSSFLRAGLIPKLREIDDAQCVFLSENDCVIRCTSDPVPAIATALKHALAANLFVTGSNDSDGVPTEQIFIDPAVKDKALALLDSSWNKSRHALAFALVEAFELVCGELPGKFCLILDQAEEVLTRLPGDRSFDENSGAFFDFIEEVYIRNIAIRIIIAMRTEYYGRFQEEMRIDDERLSKRPRSGGLESCVLYPIRDRNALIRTVRAAEEAKDEAGRAVYNLKFAPGVLEKIISDLLELRQHGSVTPILQVICASLYDGLTDSNRDITIDDYDNLGRIDGILSTYVDRGIKRAARLTGAKSESWYRLLCSLVSRQGGGTVVSFMESRDTLIERAHECGIDKKVNVALGRLSSGKKPLLRAEPPVSPSHFSLKHDILALPLVKWQFSWESANAVRDEEKHRRHRYLLAIGLMLPLLFGATYVLYDKNQALLETQGEIIRSRNSLAAAAPRSDFKQSLFWLMANLYVTDRPRVFGQSETRLRASETVAVLRSTLARVPVFSGKFLAVGIDREGRRIAALDTSGTKLRVFDVPTSSDYITFAGESRTRQFDLRLISNDPKSIPAVGFVDELGPVAFVGGRLYFWSPDGTSHAIELRLRIPKWFSTATFTKIEFARGMVFVQGVKISAEKPTEVHILSLKAADITETQSMSASAPERVIFYDRTAVGPIFSQSSHEPQYFAYLVERTARIEAPQPQSADPFDASTNTERRQFLPSNRLYVGRLSDNELFHIDFEIIEKSAHGALQPAAFTFVDGANSMLFLDAEGSLHHVSLDSFDSSTVASTGISLPAPNNPRQRTGLYRDVAPLKILPSAFPWFPPPFAASMSDSSLKFSWTTGAGVWLFSSNGPAFTEAHTLSGFTGPLINGDANPLSLKFFQNGNFLLLQQQRRSQSGIYARIWDIRSSRNDWLLNQAKEKSLRHLACAIIESDDDENLSLDADSMLNVQDLKKASPCPSS